MAYKITAKDSQAPTVNLYGEIFPWWTAKDLVDEISEMVNVATITVRISSEGGDLFSGIAIYNALKSNPAKIIVHIDSFAASIASVVAMAGDEIIMPDNTFMMIHSPLAELQGNAKRLAEAIELLNMFEGSMVSIYVEKTGLPETEIRAMLADETWMTAAECLEKGFCTEVTGAIKMAASCGQTKFNKAPSGFFAKEPDQQGEPEMADATQTPEPAKEYDYTSVLEQVESAGLPTAVARQLITAKADDAAVKARIAQSADIVKVCAEAGYPSLSASFMRASATVDEVRATIADLKVQAEATAPVNPTVKEDDKQSGASLAAKAVAKLKGAAK